MPAGNHREARCVACPERVDEEADVWCDIVLKAGQVWRDDPSLENHLRLPRGSARIKRDGHELAVRGHVVDLATIATPSRLRAAGSGNLNVRARTGEWLGHYATTAGHTALVDIGDPFAIRRKLSFDPRPERLGRAIGSRIDVQKGKAPCERCKDQMTIVRPVMRQHECALADEPRRIRAIGAHAI